MNASVTQAKNPNISKSALPLLSISSKIDSLMPKLYIIDRAFTLTLFSVSSYIWSDYKMVLPSLLISSATELDRNSDSLLLTS